MWPSFSSCGTEWEETQAQGLATKGFSSHFSKCPAPWEQPWYSHLAQHQVLCLLSPPGEPLLRPHALTHARGWSAAPRGGTSGTLASLWRQINGDWAYINGHTAQTDSFRAPDHPCCGQKRTPNKLVWCSSPMLAQLDTEKPVHCSSPQRLANLGKERIFNCGLHYGRVQKRSCWKQSAADNTAPET